MSLINKKLDKTVPIPLYFQLKSLILAEIKNGDYASGSMIPTENELVESFGISRTTVRQAITELVQEGWLYRIKSKGTFVSHPKINQDFLSRIESYNTEMERKGLRAATEVRELKRIKPGADVASHLDLKESDHVVFLSRRRFADDAPLVTIETWLPDKYCHFILDRDFTRTALYSELSASDQTRIVRIQRHIEATAASSEDVKALRIKKGSPILLTSSVGFNAFDNAIEYSVARYRGDRSAFDVQVAPEK